MEHIRTGALCWWQVRLALAGVLLVPFLPIIRCDPPAQVSTTLETVECINTMWAVRQYSEKTTDTERTVTVDTWKQVGNQPFGMSFRCICFSAALSTNV